MSQNKKNEPQFKLNYFDIIKGVLFPNRGKPTLKAPPAVPQKPVQTAYPSAPASSGASHLQQPPLRPAGSGTAPKTTQAADAPPPSTPPMPGPRPATRPASSAPPTVAHTSTTGAAKVPPFQSTPPKRPAQPNRLVFRPEKLAPAFFNVAGILSFIVNLVLIVTLIILARELFSLKALVGDHLLGGLENNFELMDAAHIRTNITVEDNIPIAFDLPISQQITVTLTQNTVIRNAIVGVLSVPTTVTLPAGTQLPIQLDLTVPVQTTIPVKLNVPVDIPLANTELHRPFIGLQDVVRPLNELLQPNTKSPEDLPCGPLRPVCNWFFITP